MPSHAPAVIGAVPWNGHNGARIVLATWLRKIKHEETYCGDLVKLRSPSEILAPLDESGVPGGLPLRPEKGVSCVRP